MEELSKEDLYELGCNYIAGTGVTADQKKGVEYVFASAKLQYPPALEASADLCFSQKLYSEAYEYYSQLSLIDMVNFIKDEVRLAKFFETSAYRIDNGKNGFDCESENTLNLFSRIADMYGEVAKSGVGDYWLAYVYGTGKRLADTEK